MPAFDAAHRPAETDAHGLWRLDPDHERVRRDDPDAARAQVFGKAGARPRLGHLQPQMETIRMRGVFGATQDTCGESRSEEHTSELQSLMRISYAVFCLKKNTHTNNT